MPRKVEYLNAEKPVYRRTDRHHLIILLLQQAEQGEKTVAEVCRQHNVSENSFYRWRTRFGGMSSNEAARVRELEKENARLKRLLAERDLEAADPLTEARAVVRQATAGGLAQRRACRLVKVSRSSARYQPHPRDERALQQQMEQIKRKHPRFGTPRVHALLRADGQLVHKRVERLWQKGGLQVPQRPKKRKIKTGRGVPCQAERPNHVWSYDFQEDSLLSGRKIRLLNVLDEFTREWLSVTVGVSLTSQTVLAALKPLFTVRGAPSFVRNDNGPEFIASEGVHRLRGAGLACRKRLCAALH